METQLARLSTIADIAKQDLNALTQTREKTQVEAINRLKRPLQAEAEAEAANSKKARQAGQAGQAGVRQVRQVSRARRTSARHDTLTNQAIHLF